MTTEYRIVPYNDQHRQDLLQTWEESVLATHDFLSAEDFTSIKELVHAIDFNELNVHCLVHEEKVIGFIGMADSKIEMLFLSPAYARKGLGRQLILYAMKTFYANLVDVNEQNENAVGFYKKMGFETYERTDKDDQGNNYPLLRMKLKSPH